MKNLLLFILLAPFISKAATTMVPDTIRYGSFGKIVIYKPASTPDAIVLFVSGDGGWNSATSKMGMQLVGQGAMVVGINISSYLSNIMKKHEKCYYPAGDCESLSLFLQKKYKFRNYYKPILAGYSSGATLVYGILAQAPANTFKGAIAMGFCPDLETIEPLCTGNGLKLHAIIPGLSWYLEPNDKLTAPFIVINGMDDKVCYYKNTESFIKKVNTGELILLPKVGHGMSVQKNYLPTLLAAYNKIKKSASYSEIVTAKNPSPKLQQINKPDIELPLIVLSLTKNDTLPLVFFISGDGGWTSFDEGVAEKLVERGMPVLGLDAQKYFWQARTPDETASEICNAIHHYLSAWNKKSFILCGYSFGADIIPYILSRMPADLTHMLKSSVMMSPDPLADFEIHVTDMLSIGSSSDTYNVPAELKRSSSKHIVCLFGEEEDNSSHALFKSAGASIKLIPGNHHYENNFNAVSFEIMTSHH
ncbi:MAG: AcvB/VirJ family lysyl-phosphatidylglycerol hydrolase [Bacteroidales bacterium]